jgi:hypothetical protein
MDGISSCYEVKNIALLIMKNACCSVECNGID